MTDRGSFPARLRVLLLARYGTDGASSRVRHYAYIDLLKARGIDVEADHLIGNDSLRRFYAGRQRRWDSIGLAYARRLARLPSLKAYDLIWIEKETLPGLPWAIERRFFGSVPTLVDNDDFWLARYGNNEASREAGKFRSLLTAATRVTVANTFLADAIEPLAGRRPIVLTNSIDADAYRAAASRRSRSVPAHRGEPMRIGWIGTPLTAQTYLPAIVPTLNGLTAEGLAHTVLIGAGNAVPELAAERLPWSIAGDADAVASVDVGIMPLDKNPFTVAKSGWKLMQCMAAGKPVVATRFGFNAELVEDGKTGFLVDSGADFEHRLRVLAHDPERRAAMGEAAQQAIATRFGQPGHADELARIIRMTAGARR